MDVEIQEQHNNFMPEAQEEVNLGGEEPPLSDVTSIIQVSSSSSEDSNSHISASNANSNAAGASGSTQTCVQQPVLPLGEGLLSLIQAYSAETDSLEGPTFPNSSMDTDPDQALDTMADNMFLPDNVYMVSPNEAHLQLTLGRVETHFFSIPEEHDLARKLSPEGFLLWEKYFAPYMYGPDKQSHSAVVDIPVSWFNFITLMLLTPEKFDWAKSFLSSQLWNILKEPMLSEESIQFAIPDKCVTTEAPLCINLLNQDEASPAGSSSNEALITPKRKRREGKSVLVESEVRRSPRLVLLNDGYKNHVNCSAKNCLTCNAIPPIVNSKVVKNLAMSFCKVPEETVARKVLKNSKIPGGDLKSTSEPGVIRSRKTRGTSSTSQSKTSGIGEDKPTAMGQQAKKKNPK
jgi:hypothetical protein